MQLTICIATFGTLTTQMSSAICIPSTASMTPAGAARARSLNSEFFFPRGFTAYIWICS